MARLKWTGGTFIDSDRGFKTTGGEHEFDDEDRVDQYLDHRSGNWVRVEAPTDATADGEDDETGDDEDDVQEVSDEELLDVLDGTNDEVAEALATGEYDDHLDRLAELEADGEDRKGATDAIEERREA